MAVLPDDLKDLIAENLDSIANQKGKDFSKIKTNQIRNVYSNINILRTNFRYSKTIKDQEELKKVYSNINRDLILLKPKLAYAKGRQTNVQPFQEFLFQLIDRTVNSTDPKLALENFFVMVESIVAYHKYHGGRDN